MFSKMLKLFTLSFTKTVKFGGFFGRKPLKMAKSDIKTRKNPQNLEKMREGLKIRCFSGVK